MKIVRFWNDAIRGLLNEKASLIRKSFVLFTSFLSRMKKHRARIAKLVFFMMISTASGAVVPLIVRYLVDEVLPTQNWNTFWLVMIAYTAALLLFQVISIYQGYLSLSIQQEVLANLSKTYISNLLKQPISRILDRQMGVHIFRATSDIASVATVITSFLTTLLSNLMTLCAAIIIMFRLQWQVTLVYLLLVPLVFLVRTLVSVRMRPLQSELRDHNEKITGFLGQLVSGVRTVKTFGNEGRESLRYFRLLRDNIRINFRVWSTQMILDRLTWVFGPGISTLLQWWIWFMVMQRFTTLGSAMAISWYFGMIMGPFTALAGTIQSIISGMIPGERVAEVLNAGKESLHQGLRADRSVLSKGISLKDVSFSYTENKAVLSRVSCTFLPGRITALVGPSGSGKTTIVNLLCGLYDGYQGEILAGDQSLRQIAMSSWRSLVALAPQEPFLFNASVEDNIRYGSRDSQYLGVDAAARLARIHDRILQLPDGYETILSLGSSDLSGGEKQRIAIARAFFRDAPVLILDEPFSNLDADSERQILDSISALTDGRIIVVISHRLSSLLFVDDMVVLDHGEIVETGSPQELLKKKGVFSAWIENSGRRPS